MARNAREGRLLADEAVIRRCTHIARYAGGLDKGDHNLLDIGAGVLGLILKRAEVPLDGYRRLTGCGDARRALGVGVAHMCLHDGTVAVPRPLAMARASKGDPYVLQKLELRRDC